MQYEVHCQFMSGRIEVARRVRPRQWSSVGRAVALIQEQLDMRCRSVPVERRQLRATEDDADHAWSEALHLLHGRGVARLAGATGYAVGIRCRTHGRLAVGESAPGARAVLAGGAADASAQMREVSIFPVSSRV